MMKSLRRIVADIEMMSLNDEITDQELTDYIKQVLKYQKLLKIKEKEAEQKEAERQSDLSKAASNCNGNSFNCVNRYNNLIL